jgi:hypothetical protein
MHLALSGDLPEKEPVQAHWLTLETQKPRAAVVLRTESGLALIDEDLPFCLCLAFRYCRTADTPPQMLTSLRHAAFFESSGASSMLTVTRNKLFLLHDYGLVVGQKNG